jgi:hypothetical protein
MPHYTSNTQAFFIGLGVKRSVTTLCGLILDEAEDQGSPSGGSHASCRECRRKNGERN